MMTRLHFSRQTVDGWSRLRPDDDLFGPGVVHGLVWSARLAQELLERTAIASGLRRRGDYEVLALLRRSQPALLNGSPDRSSALSQFVSDINGSAHAPHPVATRLRTTWLVTICVPVPPSTFSSPLPVRAALPAWASCWHSWTRGEFGILEKEHQRRLDDEAAARQRLTDDAGVKGADDSGRQLDRREFEETQAALRSSPPVTWATTGIGITDTGPTYSR